MSKTHYRINLPIHKIQTWGSCFSCSPHLILMNQSLKYTEYLPLPLDFVQFLYKQYKLQSFIYYALSFSQLCFSFGLHLIHFM